MIVDGVVFVVVGVKNIIGMFVEKLIKCIVIVKNYFINGLVMLIDVKFFVFFIVIVVGIGVMILVIV